ncbi:E3 ubiquitin-protein ligase RNF149 isoform X2 [Podarcis raffonei]|uniref:E3 ubiquitin-protein ligase RNF149 isoform X2 n=1 Tax=Podarcis raffonei TaxID=65483 RepID=UPI0023290E1D|nr:E3 ubiquitin-protein ligase RNF149 isoform X2 [Podarcis raffonei]
MVLLRRVALPLLLALAAVGCPRVAWSLVWYTAWVTTMYTEPGTNRTVQESTESGRYGDGSPKDNAQGLVGIPRGGAGSSRHMEGCAPGIDYEIPRPPGPQFAGTPPPWIALVAHGGCSLKDKIANAMRKRAAAVVIYNEPRFGNSTLTMSYNYGTGNAVVIMVGYPKGMEILELVRRGIPVRMSIGVGKQHMQEYISGQSVVFVSIAFITMMIISLAWLIFFYIQRFLYSGSHFRNQGLNVDAENCAVCIENYKPKDIVRILPCKHVFHRHCLDPWLLEHRTCPMCKLDVIKALGYWGGPADEQEVAMPESTSGSILAESWSIAVPEENRNETSDLSASSANGSASSSNGLKEDAGERTALLETDGRDNRLEEHLSNGNTV